MGEAPLSLHLDAKLVECLDSEAERQQVTPGEIAEEAIRHYLGLRATEREILRERLEEADKGVFISSESMHRWIESWGTDNELLPPEPDVFPTPRV